MKHIKSNIFSIAITAVVLMVVAFSLYAFNQYLGKFLTSIVYNVTNEYIYETLESFSETIEEERSELDDISQDWLDQSGSFQQPDTSQLSSYVSNKEADYVLISNAVGYATVTGEEGQTFDMDISSYQFIDDVIATEEAEFANFYMPDSNEKCYVYAFPYINSNSEVIGVIGNIYQGEDFYESEIVEESFVAVVDSEGVIQAEIEVADKFGISVGDQIIQDSEAIESVDGASLTETTSHLNKGESGHSVWSINDVNYMVSYSAIKMNDWQIIIGISEDFLIEQYGSVIQIITIVSFGIFIFIFGLIVFGLIKKKKYQDAVEKIAYIDKVTGCYTIDKFELLVKERLKHQKNYMAVVLDMKKLSQFNQAFGYENGDKLLKLIVKIIGEELADKELYCRESDSMFYLVLNESNDNLIKERIENVIHKINDEFKVENPDVKYKAEFVVGISKSNENARDFNEVFDNALYVCKKASKGEEKIKFYDESVRLEQAKHREIELKMESALQDREFEVFLQPKYSLLNGEMVGAEALVRWKMDGVFMPPSEFIPIFEENRFIIKLDLYVFERVCQVASELQKMQVNNIVFSSNFSRLHFANTNLFEQLNSIVEKYNVPHHLLEIEVTETVMYYDEENAVNQLTELRAKGFRVAMDDFGSGYSSLGMLKSIPLDVLKLDKAFLSDIQTKEESQIIVENIVMLAKKLKLETVAEGVEVSEQYNQLKEIGCDIAQGYFLARPMPIDDFMKIVKEK